MKLSIFVSSFILVAPVFSKDLPKKGMSPTCALPGEPLHWETDYCMFKAQTSDFHDDAVEKCMKNGSDEVWKLKDPCEQKKLFKKKICQVLKQSKDVSFSKFCEKNELPPSVADGGVDP